MSLTRNEQYVLAGAVVAAAALAAFGSKLSPGGSVKVPAASTEDVPGFTPPPGVPNPHAMDMPGPFGLVYTPHRYPPACGSEISVLIHRGYSTLALPAEGDMTWLSAPPSEAVL